jgi:hypothetical protein
LAKQDKFYIGFDTRLRGEVFSSDDPSQATPEATGYFAVSMAFDTEEEAANNLNSR